VALEISILKRENPASMMRLDRPARLPHQRRQDQLKGEDAGYRQ
jgi:hypothetical protein